MTWQANVFVLALVAVCYIVFVELHSVEFESGVVDVVAMVVLSVVTLIVALLLVTVLGVVVGVVFVVVVVVVVVVACVSVVFIDLCVISSPFLRCRSVEV